MNITQCLVSEAAHLAVNYLADSHISNASGSISAESPGLSPFRVPLPTECVDYPPV